MADSHALASVVFYGGPEFVTPHASPPKPAEGLPRNKRENLVFANPEDIVPLASSPTKYSEAITRSQIVIGGPEQVSTETIQQHVELAMQGRHAGKSVKSSIEMTDEPPREPAVIHRAHAGKATSSSVQLTDNMPEDIAARPPEGYFVDANGELRRVPRATHMGRRTHIGMAGVCDGVRTHDFVQRSYPEHPPEHPGQTRARVFGGEDSSADLEPPPPKRPIRPHEPPSQLANQHILGFSAGPAQGEAGRGAGEPAGPPPPAGGSYAAHGWNRPADNGAANLSSHDPWISSAAHYTAAAPAEGQLRYDAAARRWVLPSGETAQFDPVLHSSKLSSGPVAHANSGGYPREWRAPQNAGWTGQPPRPQYDFGSAPSCGGAPMGHYG